MDRRNLALAEEYFDESPWIASYMEMERRRGARFTKEGAAFVRVDELSRLLSRSKINTFLLAVGRRYEMQYNLALSIGRYPSTLERLRQPDLSEWSEEKLFELGQTRRAGLGGSQAMIAEMDRVCGLGERHTDFALMTAAFNRLAVYYGALYSGGDHDLRRKGWNVFQAYVSRAHVKSRSTIHMVILNASGSVCGICGKHIKYDGEIKDREGWTLDHVYPLRAGGPDAPGNIVLAHQNCNERKGRSMPSPFTVAFLERINERLGWPTPDANRIEAVD